MARRVDVEPSCPACSDQEETDLHFFFFNVHVLLKFGLFEVVQRPIFSDRMASFCFSNS